MKKILFIVLIVIICFFLNASAHEIITDGWFSVYSYEKTFNCESERVWGYYKDGVEITRRCQLLLAHRGWGDAPENSLASFKMTKENGYDGFETDVYFTRDNVAVLSHDETINRIARNADLSKIKEDIHVTDSTLRELKEYSFVATRKGKVLKEYASNKITTFEEALSYAKDNGLFIAIELKSGSESQIKSLVKMVHRYQMQYSVRYLSFDPILLKNVQIVDSYAELNLLDKSIYTKTGTCEPDYTTMYCKSITKKGIDEGIGQREYFHHLLDTKYNYVTISGETNDKANSAALVKNFPEKLADFPMDTYSVNVVSKEMMSMKHK